MIDTGLLFINKRGVLKTGWEPSTVGEYARWVSKYGSITFVHASYQLAWAGMNEAGLMISTMALEQTENPIPDESYLLFTSVDRPEGFGTGDLHISFRRKNGTWTKAKKFGRSLQHKWL